MEQHPDIQQIRQQLRTLSVEEQIQYLNGIIDAELDKSPSERDIGSIDALSALLRQVTAGTAYDVSDVKLMQMRAYTKKKARRMGKPMHSHTSCQRVTRRSRFAVAAAAFLLVFAISLPVAAHAGGFGTLGELIAYVARYLEPGEKLESNGITIIKGEEPMKYESIETFLQKTGSDVACPTALPQGVGIREVLTLGDLRTVPQSDVIFVFEDQRYSLTVSNYFWWDDPELICMRYRCTTYQAPIGTAYVFALEDVYQAVLHCGEYEYTLCAPSYTALLSLLDGLQA
ncbi:MAG: hypothetical protein IJW40_06355 [Clostridia bacterium]|nr:hypothetical protein [Clostridia bacterium]